MVGIHSASRYWHGFAAKAHLSSLLAGLHCITQFVWHQLCRLHPYLLPTVAVLLAITLGALAYRARRRQGYGPFGLGVLGAGAILFGKFASEIDVGVYAGAGLLIAASIWNLWPRRQPSIQQRVNYDESTTN